MSNVPYLASPGNIIKAFAAIKTAATPPKVSQDFVKTKLGITGSSGDQMTTFLKRLGFASADGTPTDLYRGYRGVGGGRALATAIKSAYSALYQRNEYLHECDEKSLKEIVMQETGYAKDARPLGLTVSTLRNLISLADFSEPENSASSDDRYNDAAYSISPQAQINHDMVSKTKGENVRLNLGYTINLNLPETTDIEVFNAIFKSLRANLLSSSDD
ncbi:DUF5343 domain-containing protein [Rhizobium daejeonense]|uniref:DUF5343 domain-containing protein n=1 Tax=Rhizobium daejeonense TaxID=240521 RepID=A0A6M1S2G9_9HYPH|nr:DUF5343 domain-containing protein [Rhizobium daejeonense]NGO62588.1 DUF5343 domain-containing protein [Rhizobium daejeonense]